MNAFDLSPGPFPSWGEATPAGMFYSERDDRRMGFDRLMIGENMNEFGSPLPVGEGPGEGSE